MNCYRLTSILVPVYRPGVHFNAMLASLQAQTWTAWECLLIDDGGGESIDIMEDIIRQDARFRMISQPNAGIGGARNRGLQCMRGEAFVHIDNDDLLPPHALQTLEEAHATSGAPLILGRAYFLQDNAPLPEIPLTPGGECLNASELRQALIRCIFDYRTEGMNFPSWNKLYDRATFGHFRFLTDRYGDDTFYTPYITLQAPNAYLVAETTYIHRVLSTSGSHGTPSPEWMRGYSRALIRAISLDSGTDYKKAWAQMLKWVFRTSCRAWVATGKVRHSPAAQAVLKTEVAQLAFLGVPLSFHWRLIGRVLRRGYWRLAKYLIN